MHPFSNFLRCVCISFILILAVACGGGGGSGDGNISEPDTPPDTPPTNVTEPARLHPKVGFSAFGIMSDTWDCDGFMNAIEGIREWNMAFVWNTWGQRTGCLDRVLSSPKLKSIEVHLINEPCHRHGVCYSHEFLSNISLSEWPRRLAAGDPVLLQSIRDYSRPIADYLNANMKEGVECFVSPSLESNLFNDGAIHNLIETVRPLFPRCQMVWNGLNTGLRRLNAELLETHSAGGPIPDPCIKNLDGQDIDFPERPSGSGNHLSVYDIEDYFVNTANCEMSLLWTVESNCQPPHGSISVNPRERFCGYKETIYELQMREIRHWQESHLPADLVGTPILTTEEILAQQ